MKRMLMCLSAVALGAFAVVSHAVDGVAAPLSVVLSASEGGGGDGDGDGEGATCLMCLDEHNCAFNQHDAWDAIDARFNKKGDGPHSFLSPCEVGTCADEHPVCIANFSDASTEILKASIKRNDVTRIQGLIEAHDNGLVMFNAERSAIQVLNCNGSVVAHLPVSSELASALNKVEWKGLGGAIAVAE